MTNEHIEMLTKFAKFGEASRRFGLTEEYTRISEQLAHKNVAPQTLDDLNSFMQKIERLLKTELMPNGKYISSSHWLALRQKFSSTSDTNPEQNTSSVRGVLGSASRPSNATVSKAKEAYSSWSPKNFKKMQTSITTPPNQWWQKPSSALDEPRPRPKKRLDRFI